MTRPLQISIIVSCLVILGSVQVHGQDVKAARFYYIGAMGNRPAQMDLIFDGHHVKGHLYIENDSIPLRITGSLHENGRLEIIARDSHKLSANMKGRTGRKRAEINGMWHSSNTNGQRSFHFVKVAEYLKSDIQQGLLISLSAIYPYFIFNNSTGRQLNARLQDSVLNRQRSFLMDGQAINNSSPKMLLGWEQKINYDITYFSSDLISIAGNIYLYTGGAHGMVNPLTDNFFINNGRVEELQLSSLFLPGSIYEEYLSRFCLRNLYRKGASWIKNGEVTHLAGPDLRHFSISPHGLTFYFPPYIVGPFSDGSFTVRIPFDSLRNYLNKNGPLQDLLSITSY